MATVNVNPRGTKRKNPPTFQHYPANRAKKLKRTWVEVQKVKSKWKAEKRKEGFVTKTTSAVTEHGGRGDEPSAGREEEWGGISDDGPGSELGDSDSKERDAEESEADDSDSEDAESDEDSDVSVDDAPQRSVHKNETSRGRGARGRGRGRGRGQEQQRGRARGRGRGRGRGGPPPQDTHQDEPSIRDLNNIAYARSSLHTFKSRGFRGERGGRGGRGRDTRGRGQRGHGQPDMRLRMNAMLEKIKRDLV